MDVRTPADDKRAPDVGVMTSCRFMRLTPLRACFSASLPEARRRQRYRPEDRSSKECDERYFHTTGKAHGSGPAAKSRPPDRIQGSDAGDIVVTAGVRALHAAERNSLLASA